MRELKVVLTGDHHGPPKIHRHLHHPRLRAVRVDGRIPAALPGRRPRTGRVVQLDAGPQGRRRSRRSRAGQRRRLPARVEGRRPSAASWTTCARPRSMPACRRCCSNRRGSNRPTGPRSRRSATPCSTSRSPASPSTPTWNTAATASTTWPAPPTVIFLMPSSPLDLNGVATYQVFLRGTLDKIGAYPDLHHIGDYKTASNQLTEKGYTRAHKEMDESLNRDSLQPVRPRRRRRPQEEPGRNRTPAGRGSVPAGGRTACGPGGRCGVRGPGRRTAEGRRARAGEAGEGGRCRRQRGAAAQDRRRRLLAHRRVLVRAQPRAADRRDLRHRDHQQRQERFRSR